MASSPTPKLFISHKHSDSRIADVIRTFVMTYSGGRVSVFQSSSAHASGPKPGYNLNQQLRQALWETNVVILVYTVPDQDWSYCMWECGVASNPQSPDTKIILLQCGGVSPALFADQVNVNARSLVDLQKLADELLTSPDFFPGHVGPLTKFSPHGQDVASAAADLYQKLTPLLPPEKEDPCVEWPTYPFLQLELGFDLVEKISASRVKRQAAYAVLQDNCTISAADKYCEQLFGVPSFVSGAALRHLVKAWKQAHPDADSGWVAALCSQVLAGAKWTFPPSTWKLMQGLGDTGWRAPLLNRVRKVPGRKCMQFDIYFYKVDAKAAETDYTAAPAPLARHIARGSRSKSAPRSRGKRQRTTSALPKKKANAAAKARGPRGKK